MRTGGGGMNGTQTLPPNIRYKYLIYLFQNIVNICSSHPVHTQGTVHSAHSARSGVAPVSTGQGSSSGRRQVLLQRAAGRAFYAWAEAVGDAG
jgi:hypothetical protein